MTGRFVIDEKDSWRVDSFSFGISMVVAMKKKSVDMSPEHVVSQVLGFIDLNLRGSSQELAELKTISVAQRVPVQRRLEC
ncbi:hypothetical protein IFM47457_03055 [Aspergillus lentulus]|nr:hypothetical protein IFM47457_03055 [Aspergillus lentulus]